MVMTQLFHCSLNFLLKLGTYEQFQTNCAMLQQLSLILRHKHDELL